MLLKWVAWVSLATIWGTTWLAIRVGLDVIPPITYAAVRFVVAGAVLGSVIIIRRIPGPSTRAEWLLVLSTGLQVFFFGYALQFWGMQHVSSGLSAVVFSAVPLMTMFVAHFRLHDERITGQKVAGSVVAVAGIALISKAQMNTESDLAIWGIGAFVLASIVYSNAQVTLKIAGKKLDPKVTATYQMLSGGIALVVLAGIVEGPPTSISWDTRTLVALGYLSVIGSSLAFFLLYWLLQRMEVTKVMSVLLVDPVIALGLGVAIIGETLSPTEVVGSVFALAGLAAVLLAPRQNFTG